MKPICLTIAGIDNCAVAGIYTDLKTFHSIGCFGIAAVTTLTVQTISKVIRIQPVQDKILQEQLESLFSTFSIDSMKIGMVYKKSHYKIIKTYLKKTNIPVILDPIIKSSSGTFFIEKHGIKELKDLFSSVTVVTPNIPEILYLLNNKHIPESLDDLKELCFEFYSKFSTSVLLKGGHFHHNYIYDIFFDGRDYIIFKNKKIARQHIRGTGCTHSSALTAYLGNKLPIEKALQKTKKYMIKQIQQAMPYKKNPDYYIMLHSIKNNKEL